MEERRVIRIGSVDGGRFVTELALDERVRDFDSSTTVERNHWNPVYGICYERDRASRNQLWERAEGERHWSYAASSMIVLRVSAPSAEPASHRTMCQPGPSE